MISTSFRHLFEAAGGTFNPQILAAHLHKLDTKSEEYAETLQGYLNPDISYQHSTLLPVSAYQKLLGDDITDQNFIWFSDESVRLHRVAVVQSTDPIQAMFSLGKGLFSHQTRVITSSEVHTEALIERVEGICAYSGCTFGTSPCKLPSPKKFIQKDDMIEETTFHATNRNQHWPWI